MPPMELDAVNREMIFLWPNPVNIAPAIPPRLCLEATDYTLQGGGGTPSRLKHALMAR